MNYPLLFLAVTDSDLLAHQCFLERQTARRSDEYQERYKKGQYDEIACCKTRLPGDFASCLPARFQISSRHDQAQAAKLRGVTRQAIALLVREGRFHTLSIGAETLLMRSEVEEFQPKPPGPTAKKKGNRKTRK
jgi:hypothetical protein